VKMKWPCLAFNRTVALFALIALLATAPPAGAQNAQRIKLGLLTELTGGGATSGAAANTAVRMAVKEINDRGGIAGRQIELVPGDNQSDPTVAVNEAIRLVDQQHVDIMVGPSLSQLVQAILPTTNKGKVAMVSTAASTQITPQVGPYHFSLSGTSETWSIAMVDYAVDVMKAKSAGVLGDNGAFSKDALAALKRHMATRGLPLSGEAEFAFRSTDMTPQLLTLRRGNPDVILFSVLSPEDFSRILTTLQDIHWDEPLVGAVSVTAMASVVLKQVGPGPFQKTAGLGYAQLTYCGNTPVGQSEYAQFRDRLKAFAPDSYDKFSNSVALTWYDGVYLLKAAVEGARSTDGDKVAAWIEDNASKVHAIVGPLQASKTSHFLFGPKAFAVVDKPYEVRSDGMQKRAGC